MEADVQIGKQLADFSLPIVIVQDPIEKRPKPLARFQKCRHIMPASINHKDVHLPGPAANRRIQKTPGVATVVPILCAEE